MMFLRQLPARLVATASIVAAALSACAQPSSSANRLNHLTDVDPFSIGLKSPRLITPQWIGEHGIDAVVILSVDDLRDPARHEAFLRPILERLKQIDGRAALSVMANAVPVTNAILQDWLREGVSLEVHTVTHRHPLLSESNFTASAADYHDGVALLHQIPGNRPVAIRVPYCDSLNVASPRFFAEVFGRTNSQGQFLAIDSSVGQDRKSTRLNSSHPSRSRMPSSA
jgi:hypothetical protein